MENNGDTGKTIQGHPSTNNRRYEHKLTKKFVLAAYSVFSDIFSYIKKTNISEKFREFKYKIFKIINFHFDLYFLIFLCERAETGFSTTVNVPLRGRKMGGFLVSKRPNRPLRQKFFIV